MDAKDRAAFINSVGAAVPQTSKPAPQAERKEETAEEIADVEQSPVFAEGLPDWNLEPPQTAVRRRRSL